MENFLREPKELNIAILSLGLGNEGELCVEILEEMSGFPPLGLGGPPDPPLDGPDGGLPGSSGSPESPGGPPEGV